MNFKIVARTADLKMYHTGKLQVYLYFRKLVDSNQEENFKTLQTMVANNTLVLSYSSKPRLHSWNIAVKEMFSLHLKMLGIKDICHKNNSPNKYSLIYLLGWYQRVLLHFQMIIWSMKEYFYSQNLTIRVPSLLKEVLN